MRGRAGAQSTQACTLNRMMPPPLALHPRLNLYRLRKFRVLLNSDRATVSFFWHLPRPGGCQVWAGSSSRPLVLFRLSFGWRPPILERLGPVWTRWVQGLGGFRSSERFLAPSFAGCVFALLDGAGLIQFRV